MTVPFGRPSYDELAAENARLRAELAELRRRLGIAGAPEPPPIRNIGGVTIRSSPDEKIALFMRLFAGRADVYARRWVSAKTGKSGYSPVCGNEWARGLCEKPKVKCASCPNRKLLPISKDAIYRHLLGASPLGDDVVGVYPMLADETCNFLAADFDDDGWRDDAAAFRAVCAERGLDVPLERSRSGSGAHAWFFFEKPISCATARRLATGLLTAAMERRSDLRFSSYDRLLPNQDTMPAGGFGNLIALPLQGLARRAGNSEFIDENFASYPDQWAYLDGIKPIPAAKAEKLAGELSALDELGVLSEPNESKPSGDAPKPWERRAPPPPLSASDFHGAVEIVRANGLYVPKSACSERAIGRVKRLAAFKNPAFYKAQAMRLPAARLPRVICTAEEIDGYIRVPRGLEHELISLIESAGGRAIVTDRTNAGRPINAEFLGELRPNQLEAANALLASNCGVLSATTAFGKTVTAAYLIAARGVNTLVLVHTQALMNQWRDALERFLSIPADAARTDEPMRRSGSFIGIFGGGKKRITGVVDVAIVASLSDGDDTLDLARDYGMVIADECHHAASRRYEAVLREAEAKFVYGLSATPIRQDGHHPIIFQQCGPIRWRADAKAQAAARGIIHTLIPRFTQFRKPSTAPERWHITDIYKALAENGPRNEMIAADIARAAEDGSTPLVITERVEHAALLAERVRKAVPDARVFLLTGRGTAREKAAALSELRGAGAGEKLIVVATGRYIGEGFDEPRLDALFLTMPVAWRGTVSQYAGRLHRLCEGKREVTVFDYADARVPVLERMYHKRLSAYSSLGYSGKAVPLARLRPDDSSIRIEHEEIALELSAD